MLLLSFYFWFLFDFASSTIARDPIILTKQNKQTLSTFLEHVLDEDEGTSGVIPLTSIQNKYFTFNTGVLLFTNINFEFTLTPAPYHID